MDETLRWCNFAGIPLGNVDVVDRVVQAMDVSYARSLTSHNHLVRALARFLFMIIDTRITFLDTFCLLDRKIVVLSSLSGRLVVLCIRLYFVLAVGF